MFLGAILSMISRVVFAWIIEIRNHYQSLKEFVKKIIPSVVFFLLTAAISFAIPYTKKYGPFIDLAIGISNCLSILVFFGINLLPCVINFYRDAIDFLKRKKD